MADYITPTTSSLHTSPNRKRAREVRSSTYSSSCKTAVAATPNIGEMESTETKSFNSSSSITQPRSSIHSVHNGLSSIKSQPDTSNDSINLATTAPSPIIVSKFSHRSLFVTKKILQWQINL